MNATLEDKAVISDDQKKSIDRATEIFGLIPKDAQEKALYFLEGMAAAISQHPPKASA